MKVFLEDTAEPGRYKLIQESYSRPAGEELMDLMETAAAAGAPGQDGVAGSAPPQEGVVENLTKTVKSMFRFMNSLR